MFLGSITAGAFSAMAFALFARDYFSGIILYALVGFSLGGSYTTGLILLSERYSDCQERVGHGAFYCQYFGRLCLIASAERNRLAPGGI